jgi:hypothetical protein
VPAAAAAGAFGVCNINTSWNMRSQLILCHSSCFAATLLLYTHLAVVLQLDELACAVQLHLQLPLLRAAHLQEQEKTTAQQKQQQGQRMQFDAMLSV